MAERRFDVGAHLAERAVHFQYFKQRVVAKAALAFWCLGDPPLPTALADNRRWIQMMAHKDQQALEARAALLVGHAIAAIPLRTVITALFASRTARWNYVGSGLQMFVRAARYYDNDRFQGDA